MNFQFYHEDGHGNAVDEYGREPVLMDVDNEGYPLADTVSFDSYSDSKPPEKPKTLKTPKKGVSSSTGPSNYYKKHGDDVKGHFFYLVYETGLTAGKAGQQLGIARRTAYDWLKKDQKDIMERINPDNHIETENLPPKKKAGRPVLLGEEHKKHLEDNFIDHPSATLDQAMESLTTQFSDLKVSKTTVYNFMTENCALSFKKAHFHSQERNSPASIQRRFEWVVRWAETDMDFNSNCVFIDESAFHINLKRTMAWSKKGARAEVVQPLTRAKTTTILGAISPFGVINVKVRVPYAEVSKKRKVTGGSKAQKTAGTVTGHYMNFISSTLDVMDRHEQFKGNYKFSKSPKVDKSRQSFHLRYGDLAYNPSYLGK